MTQRLYYVDPYTMQFEAAVTQRTEMDGRPAVVLNRTYFYPTGGGQPHDLGSLGGVAVIDVLSRDGAVLHVLANPIEAETVTAEIDWGRRFRHMQHHTGQHILTQAFVQVGGLNTVGFHLGQASITIDLDQPEVSAAALREVETLANRIITENRAVTATLIDPEETEGVRMRRMPDELITDGLRVIEVADFDRTACGGTHVTATGEIGLLKIIKTEKRAENTRVEFRCGRLALEDYHRKHSVLDYLSNELTCAAEDVPEIVLKLRDDLQATSKALKRAQNELIGYHAQDLLAQTPANDGLRLIAGVREDDIRALASKLVEAEGIAVALGVAGERAQIVVARSADLDLDVRPALQAALARLDGARGGGRPDFAQGGGPSAGSDQVERAVEAAAAQLRAES